MFKVTIRLLWILGALICTITIVLVAYKQHGGVEEYQHHREVYCGAFSSSEQQKAACIEEVESAKDYLPWWYVLIAWPEGITVWALVATCGAVAWQAIVTGRAADAAKLSAKAAENSSLALINSERAWIMVEARFPNNVGLAYSEHETMVHIELSIFNAGKTPAWIYERYLYLRISPETIGSQTKCSSPDFPYTGEGITMMKGHENDEVFPVTQGQKPIELETWAKCQGISNSKNGLKAYILGVIRYRDAFSAHHETYFGYSVKSSRQLERIPNEAYNKHT